MESRQEEKVERGRKEGSLVKISKGAQ